ncbi:phosphotransferase [Mycoplasma sp. 1331]|uniref:Phosphotransferase n=1 Tax=Mycoplasma tauri TaxID=547987 RepID=A0A953NGV6_9MOLU|nr:phosphotransferase [Mycoplasma tauri]MBZ4195446.1 phosphotransferase [Mycoplasma tauri]
MNIDLELIKKKIPSNIFEKISNIKLIYKGFHNYTFKCLYENEMCQLRIPASNLVNHEIESIILQKLETTLYYKNGVLIRKWFEGETLENVNLSAKIQKNVINQIKQFHTLDVDVPEINFFAYGKGTKRYQELVKKYTNKANLVTSHCDLSAKNILINKYNDIELIDFEWVRKAHPFFDAITLVQSLGFDKKIVKEMFKISEIEFDEMSYITNEFRENAYKKTYSNILINEDTKKLNNGYTNTSYVKNDLFIQKKNKNGFNHLNPLKIFNDLECVENVIYEDDEIIVRKFINNKEIDFNDEIIQNKIIKSIAEVHLSKIKLPKNQIAIRIEKYLRKLKNHSKFNEIFNNEIKDKIVKNAYELTNEVASHNDLNRENIIMNTSGKIKFIDFEYSSMNSKYFDLAYHCSDLDYDKDSELRILNFYSKNTKFELDLNEYYRVKAIVNFYGISWSLTYNPNFNFDWLAKHVLTNLKYLK